MLKTKQTWVRWIPQLHCQATLLGGDFLVFGVRISYFEMGFGSARSLSFPMSWAARSSNLLSPSSFKDLLLMLFNQKEGTFTKYTTMWRSHVIYQKTHPQHDGNRTQVQTHLETLKKIICDPRTMLLLPSDTSRSQGIGKRIRQKWPGVLRCVFGEAFFPTNWSKLEVYFCLN